MRRETSAGPQDGDAMSVQSSESAATPLVSGGDLLSLEDSGQCWLGYQWRLQISG